MKRREFIRLLGGAAAWPIAARAQQAMPIIAVLGGALDNAEVQARLKAFTGALRELGHIEGRNVRFDIRLAGDDLGRIRTHAAELARISPAAILAIVTITPTGRRTNSAASSGSRSFGFSVQR